jgi:hypothetical protein
MAINAYIKLVPSSLKQAITTEEVKDFFLYYQENTQKTGEQIEWDYEDMAFPYEIKETEAGKGKWFYLSSNHERYNVILVGVDQEMVRDENGEEREQTYIQITLDDRSVYGDKNKALEFCKYLGKKLQGEVHLFNGRVMYFYPRK